MENTLGAQSAPKYTNRPSRRTAEDERDFIFCDPDQFPSEGILRFGSYDHLFGIQLEPINKSLEAGKLHAIIVGDYTAVRQMSSLYGDQLVTVFVFCAAKILKDRIFKDPSSHRATRWAHIQEELSTIYDHLDCVTHVVNNSGSLEHSFLQVRDIVSRYALDRGERD